MKIKGSFLFLAGALLYVGIALISCNDDSTIGQSVQPDGDKITVHKDTLPLISQTIPVDSVYFRSMNVYLGEFTDSIFGTTKTDYLGQLYCPYSFEFPDDVNQIDSAFIYIQYNSWTGDSTAMFHVNVYQLNNEISSDAPYYTNIDPSDFCKKDILIGQGTYTAGDLSSSDSVKELSTYSHPVKIRLDSVFSNSILKKFRDGTYTPDNFTQMFKGIYVTTDYGNGSIIKVSNTQLELCYSTYRYSNISGVRDSFVVNAAYFPMVSDVRQVCRVSHDDLSEYIDPFDSNDSLNYIYSPAGLYTQITFNDSIFEKLKDYSIGSVLLNVSVTQVYGSNEEQYNKYALQPPSTLLLICKDSVESFFKDYGRTSRKYAYVAGYSSYTHSYSFDLSYYFQKMIRQIKDPDASYINPYKSMMLIPVDIITTSGDRDIVRYEPVLNPRAAKIRGSNHIDDPMGLKVIYLEGDIN